MPAVSNTKVRQQQATLVSYSSCDCCPSQIVTLSVRSSYSYRNLVPGSHTDVILYGVKFSVYCCLLSLRYSPPLPPYDIRLSAALATVPRTRSRPTQHSRRGLKRHSHRDGTNTNIKINININIINSNINSSAGGSAGMAATPAATVSIKAMVAVTVV